MATSAPEQLNEVHRFIGFRRYHVQCYVQNHERKIEKIIGWIIEELVYFYYGESMEYFSESNKGRRAVLDETQFICELTQKPPCTVYGHAAITKKMGYNGCQWRFRIHSIKDNIFVGIDSNPIFSNTDFSSYYRSFGVNKQDAIFCAYGSDGVIYDNNTFVSEPYGVSWGRGDIVEISLNIAKECVSFRVNGVDQGMALDNLKFDTKSYTMGVALFCEEDCVELVDFNIDYKDFSELDGGIEQKQEDDGDEHEDEDMLEFSSWMDRRGKDETGWERMFVMVKGPYISMVQTMIGVFDMNSSLIMVQVFAITTDTLRQQFMIVTMDELSGDMVEYVFRVESQAIRDYWVKNIGLHITLYL